MRARHIISALLIAAALTAGVLGPSAAADLDDQQDQIEEQIAGAEADIEALSAKVQAAAKDLATAEAKLPGARAAYLAASGRLATARDQLALIRQRLRVLAAQQDKVNLAIDQARVRIAHSEVLIARIVRYQYQTGGFAELQVLLDAESPTDLVSRLMAADSITDSQTSVIDQVTADKAVLTAREQELEVTQDAIEQSETQIEEKITELSELAETARLAAAKVEQLVSMRQDAMAVAREERAAERERLNRLQAAQAALQDQINSQTSSGGGLPNGQLSSPLPGAPMVQGVGWRVHPVYGYRSCHTGIDLSAGSGTPILAARSGTIVWTDPDLSGPYGNNTLIDHGDGLSTFYAHQSSFNVSPGQKVRTGEVIGYVGATGYATGPHLHFEVHINGIPYDPMGWFGGSKTPQSEFCP